MAHDHKLQVAVRDTIGRPRLGELTAVITAAVERGEARPDRDVALMSRLLPGLVFHQVAGLGVDLDATFTTKIIDEILLPLLT